MTSQDSMQLEVQHKKGQRSVSDVSQCYVRHDTLLVEEDLRHEFKAHRQLSDGDLSILALTKGRDGELNKEKVKRMRKSLSPFICGMLNTGLGGVIYIGVTDEGRVEGLMLSSYQKDHFNLALNDLLCRFNPPVPKHMIRAVFVPVVDPDLNENQFSVERFGLETLSTLDHELRYARYCWCDSYTIASLEKGHMHRFYVIELHFEPWNPLDSRNLPVIRDPGDLANPLFENEEGNVYMRGCGMTTKLSDRQIFQFVQVRKKQNQSKESLKTLLDVDKEFSKQLASCAIPAFEARKVNENEISSQLQRVRISKSESSDENLNNYFGCTTSSSPIEDEEVFFSYSENEDDSEVDVDEKMEIDSTSSGNLSILKSKEKMRIKMWEELKRKDCLHPYPESCINRIPNFKDNDIAANRFSRSFLFRNSKFIKVNPSLAQKPIRENVLKYNKVLLVPASSLSPTDAHGGGQFYYKLESDTFTNANSSGISRIRQIKQACSRSGSAQTGQPITLDWKDIKIDVFVVGCVVVAANGIRIGNSNNYTELEWAILVHLKAVDPNKTLVVTTVHEEQLVYEDKLPLSLLEEHDLPVDLIITPSRIINVKERLPKPSQGILWHSITKEMLQEMPILEELRKMRD